MVSLYTNQVWKLRNIITQMYITYLNETGTLKLLISYKFMKVENIFWHLVSDFGNHEIKLLLVGQIA